MGQLERLLMGQTAVGDAWALQRANIKNAGEAQTICSGVCEDICLCHFLGSHFSNHKSQAA